MSTIIIRRYNPEDLPSVITLFKEAVSAELLKIPIKQPIMRIYEKH